MQNKQESLRREKSEYMELFEELSGNLQAEIEPLESWEM